jgi:hypothetical protein
MIRKIFLCTEILVILAFSACVYNYEDPYLRINQGMTKTDVQSLLGTPSTRTFDSEIEKWYYKNDLKVINFKNDFVVSMEEDKEEIQRRHEIEEAEAGSTKVNIGVPGAPIHKRDIHPLPCAGTNFNGSFPQGGGCNENGCWPPGGSCNFWGCTMLGECNMDGCPQKISTYKCREN